MLLPIIDPDLLDDLANPRLGAGASLLCLAGALCVTMVLPVGPWAGVPVTLLVWGLALQAVESRALAPRRREAARRLLDRAIARHAAALRRNLARAERRNDYGGLVRNDRPAAIAEFLTSVGIPPGVLPPEEVEATISAALGRMQAAETAEGLDLSRIPADPTEFEAFTARALARAGWQAEARGATGDQGIDVIGRKGERTLGIQCKLQSSPVGNAAVQEALAGGRYHGLDLAAVVTNAGYTRAARDLAASAGVILLSVQDLADPDSRLPA